MTRLLDGTALLAYFRYENAYQLYQQILDNYSQARLLYYRSRIYTAMNERSLAIQDIEAALIIGQRLNLPFVDVFQQHFDKLHEQE
jgi:hypothetical protein